MYLIDTNVVSELPKGPRANDGVRAFFADSRNQPMFLSVITIGELRRGVDLLRFRNDATQADRLEEWFRAMVDTFEEHTLAIDAKVAQVWGRLLAPHATNAVDKLLAATALVYRLTVVTRNVRHFAGTGARVLNPFE